ncbi:predicted protein [Naegleria gruberi]|uniref:Predicted protein n=1 Tax=Naegleria gruberi TaxID=5762 RepID=D2VY70_NAEGR|nr:uncharacterized protein NAEGRDRAFT_73993 [Naegleria gruberi]EFC38314.1 predicted protein [Naegleria gruberi]|eukprot:XP_002671058.1 predicted protein [Naegleria gruberi strain NEG-M]
MSSFDKISTQPLDKSTATCQQEVKPPQHIKSTITSIKSPKSNTTKISKSINSKSFVSTIQIRTCFGTVLECDCVRLLLLLGMIINIISFIVIGSMTIYSYTVVNKPIMETLVSYNDMSYQYQLTTNDINLGVIGSHNASIHDWVTRKDIFKQSIGKLLNLVDSDISNTIQNEYNITAQNISLLNLHQEIVDIFLEGNLSAASSLLLSANVNSAIRQFANGWNYMLTKIKANIQNNLNISQQASTTSLTIIGVCLLIAIPIVVLTFTLMIKKDISMSRKLRKTQIVLVLNTMNDTLSRKSFKNYLVNSKSAKFHHLLELIQRFKEISNTLAYVSKLIANNNNSSVNTSLNGSLNSLTDDSDTSSMSSSIVDLNTSTSTSSMITYNTLQSIEQEEINLKQELNQIVIEITKLISSHKEYSQLCKLSEESIGKVIQPSIFDELEKYLAEKLIRKHDNFKSHHDIPLQTRYEMLRNFRFDFKRQYNRFK